MVEIGAVHHVLDLRLFNVYPLADALAFACGLGYDVAGAFDLGLNGDAQEGVPIVLVEAVGHFVGFDGLCPVRAVEFGDGWNEVEFGYVDVGRVEVNVH